MPRKRIAKDITPKEEKGFNGGAFYSALSRVVLARKVPWIKVSRETGVSTSTLSRMAVGRGPDAASLAVLSAWAGLNPADFVNKSRAGTSDSLPSSGSSSDTANAESRARPSSAAEYAAIGRFEYEQGHLSVVYDQLSESPSFSRRRFKVEKQEGLKEANFSLWANRSLWTIDEAAFLLLGYEPMAESEISRGNFPEGYAVIRRLLLRKAGANRRTFEGDPRRGPRLRAWDVIEWAQSRSLLVPPQLRDRRS